MRDGFLSALDSQFCSPLTRAMVVSARLDWVMRQSAAGRDVHFSLSQARDAGKAKIKMVLAPAGASSASPVQAAALRALVEAILVQLPIFTAVDRGHLHSDGTSVVQVWLSPRHAGASGLPARVVPPARAQGPGEDGDPVARGAGRGSGHGSAGHTLRHRASDTLSAAPREDDHPDSSQEEEPADVAIQMPVMEAAAALPPLMSTPGGTSTIPELSRQLQALSERVTPVMHGTGFPLPQWPASVAAPSAPSLAELERQLKALQDSS